MKRDKLAKQFVPQSRLIPKSRMEILREFDGADKTKHTPTPLGIDPEKFEECLLKFGYHPETRAKIVRAVDCHEQLLKYARRYAELCKRSGGDWQSVEQAIAKAEAA